MPLRREAANLSRMRSPITSRSNWAKDNSTLRVKRPIDVVVLKDWVTETKVTFWRSKTSTSREKSISDRDRRSDGGLCRDEGRGRSADALSRKGARSPRDRGEYCCARRH